MEDSGTAEQDWVGAKQGGRAAGRRSSARMGAAGGSAGCRAATLVEDGDWVGLEARARPVTHMGF